MNKSNRFSIEAIGRFVTVAMSEDRDKFADARERTLIGDRFGAYIEQENRAFG